LKANNLKKNTYGIRKCESRNLPSKLHQLPPSPPNSTGVCSIHLNKHLKRKQNAYFYATPSDVFYNISFPKLSAYSEEIKNQNFRISGIKEVVV